MTHCFSYSHFKLYEINPLYISPHKHFTLLQYLPSCPLYLSMFHFYIWDKKADNFSRQYPVLFCFLFYFCIWGILPTLYVSSFHPLLLQKIFAYAFFIWNASLLFHFSLIYFIYFIKNI